MGLDEDVIYVGTLTKLEVAEETSNLVLSQLGIGGTWNKISRIARERKEKNYVLDRLGGP